MSGACEEVWMVAKISVNHNIITNINDLCLTIVIRATLLECEIMAGCIENFWGGGVVDICLERRCPHLGS